MQKNAVGNSTVESQSLAVIFINLGFIDGLGDIVDNPAIGAWK